MYEQISAFGCNVPLSYRIGTIDEGFGTTLAEAKAAVAEAELMWEELVGEDLFVYDDTSDFTVNFVFDTRQQLTLEEQALREVLNEKEGLSDAIKNQYSALVAEYEEKKVLYERARIEYDADLAAYNAEVANWNDEGGAPQEEYERLSQTQDELAARSRELSTQVRTLNQLVAQLNNLSETGNRVVEEYNRDVAQYNDRFNHEYEFTQGDYQGDRINIYQFDSEQELRTVLAHELGHALRLQHVDDPDSIMYYLMDIEEHQGGLTLHDWNEYKRVCETPWYQNLPF